jgi:hypothetical protein
VTEINDSKQFGVEVYPNPFTDLLNFRQVESGSVVELYSVDGRLVRQQVYTGTSMNLSGEEVLSPGVYIVKISHSNGMVMLSVVKQ